jgi:hypothetical protein
MTTATDQFNALVNDAQSRYTWQRNNALLNFQANVTALCKQRGWARPELARRLGISRALLAHHLDGSNLTLDSVARYAHVFGVGVADLVSEPKAVAPYALVDGEGVMVGSYGAVSDTATATMPVKW